jgi:D-serine deaminase-like pyridoxal phosphate-dependent protein
MRTAELPTPALLLDADALEHNLATMASLLPGDHLRPHVKAHKCTALARRQVAHGHNGFTAATIREVEGMAAAGLGHDLLLANELADARRLGAVIEGGARVTLAVDSPETIAAAAAGGVREVVIDVNVGLPRFGCDPGSAGALADLARTRGLSVRGVMGYEGHLMMVLDPAEQRARVEASMALLLRAHHDVGGDLVSAGGTGTHHLNIWAGEIQAGSYALMDSAYAQHGFGFRQALWIEATVIARNAKGWAVADCGLKANGMDHGNPALPGADVLFLSDEHVTFEPHDDGVLADVRVGSRVRVIPAHCDPTVAYHEAMWLVRGDEVLERWAVDLRGW